MFMIYRSETWAMTPRMGRVLGGLHHRVDHRLTGRKSRRGQVIVWVYPPVEDSMAEAGLKEVETYVSFRQNTVAQFISTRTIIDLCLAVERSLG